ncbi:NAD-dependent epimerase/dehydratase family protein [Streptomyces sp. AJS327]|uniref:NAD-dependent epimerase/dehydratase family protein n=1 Tax=Streptomyces sp. AJS327 TaxID=2545265 RepID=UPI0015DDE39D|nr:NAD-dependent epimerase/dehydratase family protein [Streptomyces sp. AJS327]MBA0051646.1 NAD-dependent epimerase/dehydratase family protein [Streptomyces sp. AJS327]
MRLLILGGTEFVGRAVAEEARRRAWHVTVFHRGHTTPPEGVTALRGDRVGEGGLAALAEGTWDVVLDTWSGDPEAVRAAARLLADRAGHYVYVSSRSVYTFPAAPGADENWPLVDAAPEAVPGDAAGEYARAKRAGEAAAREVFGERALLARAGLILGPHENVGRLPWWLRRMARGGPVLAPGPREHPLQYVDVRDLAIWMLDSAARGLGGAFNLASPRAFTTTGELLETCVEVTGGHAEPRWAEPGRILDAGIEPWTELPIWLPPGEAHGAMLDADVSRALASGLRCRPVGETVRDTWEWLRGLDGARLDAHPRAVRGLAPEREAELLRSLP